METHAIVRRPGRNFSRGITTANLGAPNYQKSLRQHRAYCKVLERCGLKLMVLDPDLLHPDAPFVEDTAIIAGKLAMITRLGDVRRRGEEERISGILAGTFGIRTIQPPGSIDGGDVLKINNHFYVGISQRTNESGAKQLSSFLLEEGFTSSFVPVVNSLHLKTGATYIGNNTIIATQEFARMEEFGKFRIVVVNPDDSYAANCLLVNGNLLIPANFPNAKERIQEISKIDIIEVQMSEFQKMNGGLTCLSIIF